MSDLIVPPFDGVGHGALPVMTLIGPVVRVGIPLPSDLLAQRAST